MAGSTVDAGAVPRAAQPPTSMLRRAIGKFIRHPGGMVGLAMFIALVLIAVFAPVFAPHDPLRVDPIVALMPPSAEHWMGTDTLGRDVMSRVVFGARISLRLGVVSVSIGLSLGVLIGVLAGYLGGRVDGILMRFIDMLLAFPSLILALVAVFALGPGLTNAMIAVGISSIPAFARITRGEVLSAKENLYVQSAQALGGSEIAIMARHILPNIIAPNIVMGALMTGTAILAGAALSFLGLGAQSPTPEWGLMLSQGRGFMSLAWWLTFFPGLGIMLTVMAMNLLGDGLRDVLDPRTR